MKVIPMLAGVDAPPPPAITTVSLSVVAFSFAIFA